MQTLPNELIETIDSHISSFTDRCSFNRVCKANASLLQKNLWKDVLSRHGLVIDVTEDGFEMPMENTEFRDLPRWMGEPRRVGLGWLSRNTKLSRVCMEAVRRLFVEMDGFDVRNLQLIGQLFSHLEEVYATHQDQDARICWVSVTSNPTNFQTPLLLMIWKGRGKDHNLCRRNRSSRSGSNWVEEVAFVYQKKEGL